MGSIIIRRVKAEDYEDVYLLSCELGYTYPKENLKERIRYITDQTNDIILVAEIKSETEDGFNSEVVGYIHGSPYELMYQDSIINILGFVVKEKNRGTGIGNSLMAELEKTAKERGFTGCRLTSGALRTGAHRFYENHGFSNQKTSYKFIKNF